MVRSESVITTARKELHNRLVSNGTLSISQEDIASNADKSQRTSRDIALHIAQSLGAATLDKGAGQTAGSMFEGAVREFLAETMVRMRSIRPGSWNVVNVGGSRAIDHLAKYEPYRHLDDLARAIQINRDLLSVLGNSYSISPDVLVLRTAENDATINEFETVVDDQSANLSPFRATNHPQGELAAPAFVHAVVSCKWTMRSDRSQNTRSEALNLIRNRKGRAPHIVAVTAEPTPSRISSLALGTGDIDMVYHFALPELVAAVDATGNDEAITMLNILIEGERLRDVSDMPLDLSV